MVTLPAFFPYPVNAMLLLGALAPALFFKGTQLEFLATSIFLLMVWLGRILWLGYAPGWAVPRSPVTLTLSLWWVWLGLSALLSPAPATSTVTFWWVGALPLVFWLYTLSPERDALWRFCAPMILIAALVLALFSASQVFLSDAAARSVFETRNSHAAFLNLVVLPASAYFLLAWRDPAVTRGERAVLGAAVFLLCCSIFLAAGRGASLSLVLAGAVLLGLTWRYVDRRATWVILALAASAFGLVQLGHGELSERLPSLAQDGQRELIWRSTLNLIADHPWLGVGLGLFFLAYPPYRHVDDSSGGFFAHNDYLQFWAETGLPGMLLLFGVLASVAVLMWRVWRSTSLTPAVRVETAGLFAGLLAVAGHSAVDFNFYILSILIVAGLALGRWHQQIAAAGHVRHWQINVTNSIGPRTYPLNVAILVMIGFLFFVTVGVTNPLHERAIARARDGDIQGASRSLSLMAMLNPRDDRAPLSHADLLRHLLRLEIATTEADRRALFQDAVEYLDEAAAANPLRPQPHIVRARLYREQPALAGPQAAEISSAAFARALEMNPLLPTVRAEYAQLRLDQSRPSDAATILAGGVRYPYPEGPETMAYYELAVRVLRRYGDSESLAVAETRLASIKESLRSRVSLKP